MINLGGALKLKNKILIVEDSTINRAILANILQNEYDIIEAANGQEAYDIISKQYNEISAMILDLLMPVMDGKELLSLLSKEDLYSNLPVLIATGEHNDQLESQCLELGAWDFVTKPYNPIVIKLRLRNIIGRSQTHLLSRIRTLAEKDTLTGLYNRQYFMKATVSMLKNNSNTRFVFVRMDIDHFRLYNSSFGSQAGNLLLKRIARGIEQKLEENDVTVCTYGRISSDIFCVCMPYRQERLENLLDNVEYEIQRMCSTYRLKASFGLYVIENSNTDMEAVYAHSTEAASVCKNNLNTIYAYYGSEMSMKEEKAQRFTNEMSTAIEERQFLVYLQPKYSIETGKACGAEALVRWKHPEWGMVSPGDFIPVFEQNGLIVQLDYYMWENVCQILAKWQNKGMVLFPVSVNISRISMYNPKIVEQLVGLTKKYNIPKHLLNLEITESAYMSNPDLMKDIIDDLRHNGFVILMDDFGSGYSSLNTLKDIDVDILKIDMKFLPTGHNNAKSEKILASIARMAGWLGVPVVVEGVETKEQKDFLESIGCTYVQGYYYAKPMPVEDYEQLLVNENSVRLTKKDCSKNNELIITDLDTIWSSDSQTGTLLKSVSVPFAIFEYAHSQVDILRKNQCYSEKFGNKSLEAYLIHKEYYKLLTAVDEAVDSKMGSDSECLFIMNDGDTKWYHIHLIYIGTVGKTSLISATFSDVTAERILEKELNTVFSALKPENKAKDSLLIIDDLQISREVLSLLFEDEYKIIQAADGQQGLDLLGENCERIVAILLDMMMPKMNGQEFLQYKNRMLNASDIPVIVISAESDEAVQIHMLENGVNDYITKPYVPAVVKKRLSNVLEYNSRFRNLVREFKKASSLSITDGKSISLKGYGIAEVRRMIRFMSEVFDIVRLVDPANTAVVTIGENEKIEKVPYSCFSVWGKNVRCENCTSLCAMKGHCTLNKFELLKKDVFYVVSQPVEIFFDDNVSEKLVLEIASKISDEYQSANEEINSVYKMLEDAHSMIYIDPLTNAYNRRYLDEMLFLQHGQNGIAKKVAIIMMDLFRFKQANDLFGHQTGDMVLKGVADVLKSQIRQNDSLVRYGGDEFIIVLTNCNEDVIEDSIVRFKDVIATVCYGPHNTIATEADFGYSYTDDFKQNTEELMRMVSSADMMMYANRNRHYETH